MIKATITPSISCAVVKLNEDASLSIYTGTVEMGQGSETVLAQIAGKELGIPLETIQVLGVDTDVVPYDLTTSSSRSTFHMGKAVQLAAQDVMRQLKQIVVKNGVRMTSVFLRRQNSSPRPSSTTLRVFKLVRHAGELVGDER
jgi:CO/xanthine dehydrogenase Mo-binding subunit